MKQTSKSLKSNRRELGGGIYSLHNLRTYLAFSGKPEDGNHALRWLTDVLNPVSHTPRQPDYTFSDLVSLFVVRELLRKGVRPRTIRDAEEWLRGELGIDRPLVSEDIKTDGVEVFYRDEVIPGQIEAASKRGQQTIREAIKEKLVSVRYTDGTATSWEPAQGIVLDPQIQFGDPTIADSRLPTEIVAGVGENLGIAQAASRFHISPAIVKSAMAFENQLAALT
jgi:uncharacterized protein (DUF433 family)